jgi:hypothetical protein
LPVRHLHARDVPRIAQLQKSVFNGDKSPPSKQLVQYIHDVYMDYPLSANKDLQSLVFEHDGSVVGFIGVTPHSWKWQGRDVIAVTSSQYMVDPEFRSPVAAIELLKTLLAGPQEFTIADGANEVSLRLWTRLGGRVSHLYNLFWEKRFEQEADTATDSNELVPLTPEMMAEHGESVLDRFDPRPLYRADEIGWVIRHSSAKRRFGPLRMMAVRDSQSGSVQGWFCYYSKPGDRARVMQVAATPMTASVVVGRMFKDMAAQGASGASGRVEPFLIETLSRYGATYNRGFDGHGHYALIHSKNVPLLNALLTGEGFMSRFEGEGWYNFAEQGGGQS